VAMMGRASPSSENHPSRRVWRRARSVRARRWERQRRAPCLHKAVAARFPPAGRLARFSSL